MPHKQVTAKVNMPVDEHTAFLVEALSDYRSLVVTESHAAGPGKYVQVKFIMGTGWKELAAFLNRLSGMLGDNDNLRDASYTLGMEWARRREVVQGFVRVRTLCDDVLLAKAVRVAIAKMNEEDQAKGGK